MSENPYESPDGEPEPTNRRRLQFWLEWAVLAAIVVVLIAWWATGPTEYPYRE